MRKDKSGEWASGHRSMKEEYFRKRKPQMNWLEGRRNSSEFSSQSSPPAVVGSWEVGQVLLGISLLEVECLSPFWSIKTLAAPGGRWKQRVLLKQRLPSGKSLSESLENHAALPLSR